MQAKESAKLDYNKLKSSVLIVDIGSSTTDFTLSRACTKYRQISSNALGLPWSTRPFCPDSLTMSKVLLKEVFEEYPHHQARCELACRKAKEDYFSNEPIQRSSIICTRFESINEQIYFIPKLTDRSWRRSWTSPCRNWGTRVGFSPFVRRWVRQRKSSNNSIVPKVVLMTGGASRMQFTRQICESSSRTRIPGSLHPEPERCIALGLHSVEKMGSRRCI